MDPSKCATEQVQNIPEDIRRDLKLQKDNSHQLPLFAHLRKIKLHKTKSEEEILVECTVPSYFESAVEHLV